MISAILILFNVYGFSNKSSPEIIKLSLNPFITNAPSVSDGQCETKYTVDLVHFLEKVANTMSTLIGKPGKLIQVFRSVTQTDFWKTHPDRLISFLILDPIFYKNWMKVLIKFWWMGFPEIGLRKIEISKNSGRICQ